ncbi:MAG: hypothetical protein L0Y54_21255, partial [Sporichthyaceae bacterium]|nr:hypothetical protein [Sporichthyaceae bacterium]
MLPAPANAPSSRPRPRPGTQALLTEYLASLTARGAGNSSFERAARTFLTRWPYPQGWAGQSLAVRLSANAATRPLLTYLMLAGHLRPGYDYLLERKLPSLLREAPASPLGDELAKFLSAGEELGYSRQVTAGFACQVGMRLLIQTGRTLTALIDADLHEFTAAIAERERAHGKALKHYYSALYATRAVIYHLGAAVTTTGKRLAQQPWPWSHHFVGVNDAIAASLVSYLECAAGTRTRSTVSGMAGRLAHFGRFLAAIDPTLSSLAVLGRQQHIEPYLAAVAAARNPRTGAVLSASERRSRILTVGRMIDDVIEWGWAQAPARRLVFSGDIP